MDQQNSKLVEICERLKRNDPTLTELGLGGNGIDSKGVEALAEALKSNTTLTQLDLEDNQIDSKGAELLAEALKSNTTLTQLNLEDNQIDSKTKENLVRFLNLRNQILKTLTTKEIVLEFSEKKLSELPPLITKLTHLQSLNLNNNHFSSLPQPLTCLSSLTQLLISSNKFTTFPNTILALTKLQRLDVSHNRITILPNELTTLTSLQQLKIKGNNFSFLPSNLSKKYFNFKDICNLLEVQRMLQNRVSPDNSQSASQNQLSLQDLTLSNIPFAKGASAVVYRGTYKEIIDVAVKKFLITSQQDDIKKLSEIFKKEVEILQKLHHPNVVICLGGYSDPQNISIVLEYCNGGSLFNLLHEPKETKEKLSTQQQLEYALQIAEGMEYLHSHNPMIVHRDLKSLNILLNNGILKIADFGVSKTKGLFTSSLHSHVGTHNWMAPEVMKAKKGESYNEKADVWSFGMVLYELTTNTIPYDYCEYPTTEVLVDKKTPPIPNQIEIHPTLLNLMNQCWNWDPQQRPSFSQIVQTLRDGNKGYISSEQDGGYTSFIRYNALFQPAFEFLEGYETNPAPNLENINWNERFQTFVDNILRKGDLVENYQKLSQLARDFIESAKVFSQIFVSEYRLKKKTINLEDVGGEAGEIKFKCNNILFKFAVDKNNLYQGHHNAMKAANHELRYLNEVFEARIPSLHIPLICTVDWCGFRVIAMSILPIGRYTTIKYGSCDAGTTIQCDKEFEKLMEELAKKLNLSKHKCGLESRESNVTQTVAELWTCIDLEGHKGTDGRNYVIDPARLFPPEYIDPQQQSKVPTSYLFLHLRPELVRKWRGKPLNPDSFSPFVQVNDPQTRTQHENEIKACTEHLKNVVIPQFVEKLIKKSEDIMKLQFFTLDRLITALHKDGINIRYLGLVRKHLESRMESPTNNTNQTDVDRMRGMKVLSDLIFVEMICRVIKNRLNYLMREQMSVINAPSFQPFQKLVIDAFNEILCSQQFWTSTVKEMIVNKFSPDSLTVNERHPNVNIAPHDPIKLISRLEQLLGVKLYPASKNDLRYLFEQQRNLLSVEDIQYYDVRVKTLSIVRYADAISDYHQAQKTTDEALKHRLLEKAIHNFEISRLKSFYHEDKEDLKEMMNMWGDSLKKYGLLIELDPKCTTRSELLRIGRDKIAFEMSDHDKAKQLSSQILMRVKGASYYFKRAFRKYQQTRSWQKIFELVADGSRKLIELAHPLKHFFEDPRTHKTVIEDSEEVVKEILAFLKRVLGENYYQPLSTGRLSSFDSEKLGASFYHVAFLIYEISENRELYKTLLQVSGKYFEESIRSSPSLYRPISLFINEIKEKEDIAHIMRILRINKGLMMNRSQPPPTPISEVPPVSQPVGSNSPPSVVISKFSSSWAPHISLNAFVQLLKHSSLTSLVLNGTQIDCAVVEKLPSFEKQLENLKILAFQNFPKLTKEEVKAIASRFQQLQKLVINNCSNIQPTDLKDFKPNQNCEVFVNHQIVSDTTQIIQSPLPGRFHSTTTGHGKTRINNLFARDYRLLTSFGEYMIFMERWMKKCDCRDFAVNGVQILWSDVKSTPKEFCDEFCKWVRETLDLQEDKNRNLSMKKPDEISNWSEVKLKIYRGLFFLALHLAQVHSNIFGPGRRFESFSTLREIIKWGRIYHLISPEELIRHNNIVSKIEREGSAPGIPDEDIVVYEQPEEPEN